MPGNAVQTALACLFFPFSFRTNAHRAARLRFSHTRTRFPLIHVMNKDSFITTLKETTLLLTLPLIIGCLMLTNSSTALSIFLAVFGSLWIGRDEVSIGKLFWMPAKQFSYVSLPCSF